MHLNLSLNPGFQKNQNSPLKSKLYGRSGIRIPVRPDIYRTYNQIRTKFMVFYRYTQIIIYNLSFE